MTIAPRLGRAFDPAEDEAGAAPAVILGDDVWRRRFSSDPGVLGRVIEVDGVSTTIVGVMPPATFLSGPLAGDDELWLPARMTPAERDNAIGHSLVASIALAPLLRAMLFETRPADPATYGVVLVSLGLLTIAASLVPARRAMLVDPLTALRSE